MLSLFMRCRPPWSDVIRAGALVATRRQFLAAGSLSLGALALSALEGVAGGSEAVAPVHSGGTHFPARARRVIHLHMAGGPSQLELFDWKPELARRDGQECPESLLKGRRFAFLRDRADLLGPQAAFAQHGESGAWISDRLPHFAGVADSAAFIKTLQTDQINHAPAQLFAQTGSALPGRPGMGSWAAYGLGSANENLPAYIVLLSGGKAPDAGKSIWGNGFLPGVYQGIECRCSGDPLLFGSDPAGVTRGERRSTIDAINAINQRHYEEVGSPEILTRIAQYELAFRMQAAAPEAFDLAAEPERERERYGAELGKVSFANNCLLARRLAERNVRWVQLFDWGWDSHGSTEGESLGAAFSNKARSIDKPMAALLGDLKERGLLEETLVVWSGEFGRTPMRERRQGRTTPYPGRDHHPHAATAWLAGGGIRPGVTVGETDELGCFAVRDPVHMHDLQATILHCLGFDHERLVYPLQGRDFRLTDVSGRVVASLLA